jgi:hypothetical protein
MPLRNQMSPSNPVRPPFRSSSKHAFYADSTKRAKSGPALWGKKALQTGKVFVYLDLSGDVVDNDSPKAGQVHPAHPYGLGGPLSHVRQQGKQHIPMNQDQLRAKSLALFHALVSNWANDLRKEVTGLQDELLQKLDQLQERMSKYEENIDEERILAFANEAAALVRGGGAGGSGDALKKVRASIGKIEHGTSLTEVLTILLEELSQFAPRVALFILKGGSCIGWNGRGFDSGPGFSNDAIKKISVPTSAETLFSAVINSRSGFVGESNRHRDNVQLLSRIGNVLPSSIFATPLILRDRIAAVVYADSGDGAGKLDQSEALEILTNYAAKLLDALSAQKTTGRTGEHTPPPAPPAPAPVPRPAARGNVASPVPASRAVEEEDEETSGTIMFSTAEMNLQSLGTAAKKERARAPSPGAGAGPDLSGLDPETRKKHEEAQRFARLLVSEIKLYNESKVQQGRASRDLYDLLRDDIERSRQLYRERVSENIRVSTNYFNDELIRILADGDDGAMGQTLPAT